MLRSGNLTVAVLVSLLGMASVAAAGVTGTLDKGAAEVTGTAGVTSMSVSGSTVTSTSAQVGYGYFMTRNWEIFPELLLAGLSSDGSSLWGFGGTLSGVYNFTAPGDDTVPYLRLGLGFVTTSGGGESVSSTILPVAGAGIRLLIGSSASVNFGATYERTTESQGGQSISANTVGFQAGVSVFPRGFGGK